jgi:hypothetical protein
LARRLRAKAGAGTRILVSVWAVAVGLLLSAAAPVANGDDIDRAAEELTAKYRTQLDELAAWCQSHGLAEQARKTRSWLRPRDPNKLYVAILPQAVGRPPLADNAPENLVTWDAQLAELQRRQAAALFDLARKAVQHNRASLAFDLMMAAIHEYPDHEAIRRILGYQKYQDQWRSADEVANLKKGMVWDATFGWLPKSRVHRYHDGERYANGRWISAEEDARLHHDIQAGWVVQTDHYRVQTNDSLESGVKLGQSLERLYRVWKQLFIRYYFSEDQVAALVDGRNRSRRSDLPRFGVVYFRDRDEYVRYLQPFFPNIAISVGFYDDSRRQAFFFAGKDYDPRTLNHEATHQLFNESRPVAPAVGRRDNFWVIEGIAMYMESLHEEDGFCVLGGADDLRMQDARVRLLDDNFYLPLADFIPMGMAQVQADKHIATLYSQAAGLTHFLIHGQEGRYRDALVSYLTAIYCGQANTATLSQLTGTSYEELDRQYRQFMAKK